MILGIGAAVYVILFILMRKDMLKKGVKGIKRASGLAALISLICMLVNTTILGNTDLYSAENNRITEFDPVNFPVLIILIVSIITAFTAGTADLIISRKAYDRKLLREMEQQIKADRKKR